MVGLVFEQVEDQIPEISLLGHALRAPMTKMLPIKYDYYLAFLEPQAIALLRRPGARSAGLSLLGLAVEL
jgi:hypothetical protein